MPLCSTSKVPRGVRRASTVAVAVATIATTTIPGETALASSTEGLLPAQADPCPAAFPIEELTAGQALEGLTVDSGTTPEPFTATVIGVLEDVIAPGFPLVIVTASSPAITDAGGIWAGMSGSPVYAADGRLVGAVAYGFAASIADRRHHPVLGDGSSCSAAVVPKSPRRRLTSPPPSRRSSWRAARSPQRKPRPA